MPAHRDRAVAFATLFTSARSELLVAQSSQRDAGDEQVNIEVAPADMLQRGVTMKFLYDDEALHDPAFLRAALHEVSLGAEARVTSGIPADFAVVDRHALLVTTSLDPPNAMYPEAKPLVRAFIGLFEAAWKVARPLRALDQQQRDQGLTESHQAVLALVLSGLNNDAVSRTLKLNRRTVGRRVTDLIGAYQVVNRNGLIAAAAAAAAADLVT
jgi:DNA-binding CsgD family transcriptional regulator